jgi:anti-sigma factor RsiW
MNCSEFRKQISLLIDGELKGSGIEALQLHLEGCPDCRKINEQMVALADNVKAIRGPLEAFSMAQRVKERVAAERARREKKEFFPAWGRVPLVAMMLLLAIGLGNLAGRSVSEMLNPNRSEATLVDYVVPYQNGSLAEVVLTMGAEESSR